MKSRPLFLIITFALGILHARSVLAVEPQEAAPAVETSSTSVVEMSSAPAVEASSASAEAPPEPPSPPCRDGVAETDVTFRAKALATQGANTEMDVLEWARGDGLPTRITFTHPPPPDVVKAQPPDEEPPTYNLATGSLYFIYAKKTDQPNVFSQPPGIFCADTVILDRE